MPIGTPVGNLDIANATLRTSNLETQNIKIGSIFVGTGNSLEETANVGNSMSNTIQFTNTHTAFTTTGNVTVGKELTVTGNVTVSKDLTVTEELAVTGNATFSGTGALTVPSGTTAEQPTGVAGMIRYNSTLNKYEGRVSTIWMPMTGDAPLYEFISHTFTNAGVTGNNGPEIADLTTSYSPTWTDNTNYLNMVTQGFQLWTVPKTGTYTIDAYGGSGGLNPYWTVTSNKGGRGARVRGNFIFTKGTKINIVIGQKSNPQTQPSGTQASQHGTGGGGATWVFKETFTAGTAGDIYIVAGGGGGGGYYYDQGSMGGDGIASQGSATSGGTGGSYAEGGGAGWGGESASVSWDSHGRAVGSGFVGGNQTTWSTPLNRTPPPDSLGGFGGGGSGSLYQGGGGGGYYGGNANGSGGNNAALGGGSRNNGTSLYWDYNTYDTDGKCIITYVE